MIENMTDKVTDKIPTLQDFKKDVKSSISYIFMLIFFLYFFYNEFFKKGDCSEKTAILETVIKENKEMHNNMQKQMSDRIIKLESALDVKTGVLNEVQTKLSQVDSQLINVGG